MGWNLFKKEPDLGRTFESIDVDKMKEAIMEYFWEKEKTNYPEKVKEIEQLLHRNISHLDGKNAMEIIRSLRLWAGEAKVPIAQLRNWTIDNMSYIKDRASLNRALPGLEAEKLKEAKTNNISPKNTKYNFMIEFLSDHVWELGQNALNAALAALGMSWSKQYNIIYDPKNPEEQNIAPDTSKLDMEENKLFSLAKRASKMFDKFNNGIDTEPIQLAIEGEIEARILCSTMVIELEPYLNFKNEIDMGYEWNRYFLLLARSIISDAPKKIENVIDFINNRLAFYYNQRAEHKDMNILDVFINDNPLCKIYNALYNCPLSERIEDDADFCVNPNELVMFKALYERVRKYIRVERDSIVGNNTYAEEAIKSRILEILEETIPQARRNAVNQDVAWLFSDQIIGMLKSGHIDSKLERVLPFELVNKIQDLISICTNKNNISETSLADILEATQQDFISQFNL